MKRGLFTLVVVLLGCRSPAAVGPVEPTKPADPQQPAAPIELPPEQKIEREWPTVTGPACSQPSSQPEPVTRKPRRRRVGALAYPPTYSATKPGAVELADAALGHDLAVTMVQIERWGGFVSELATTSPEFGGGRNCLSDAKVLEHWADLLAKHAELFGIDQPFTIEGQGNHLVVQHPELSAPIMITKNGSDGPARLVGHWWPGLLPPPDVLTAEQLRANASRYRLTRVEWVPKPVDCTPGDACAQQMIETFVDAGPLAGEHITELLTAWIGTGAGQHLEFRLVTQIVTGPGQQFAIDGVSGQLYSEVERPAAMWFNLNLHDNGRKLLAQ